ncbi:DNA polymerase I A, chloroplastic/mitochondrial-like [Phalaenopsis equestris]|uniref:DNA polymerase I A, chloroplastic/mitochondrial-like n=1 Tax=Phalaenopsis equestris TaxID=78828 RepID=UPI0009E337E0|nr:DNA polymerase I A, chloroplastic/mitochondrial-like [Phalaenopsis equestris]
MAPKKTDFSARSTNPECRKRQSGVPAAPIESSDGAESNLIPSAAPSANVNNLKSSLARKSNIKKTEAPTIFRLCRVRYRPMQKCFKTFLLISFGVSYPRGVALSLPPSYCNKSMSVSVKHVLFHSLCYSSSIHRKEHDSISSLLSRKRDILSLQGCRIQHWNFSTCSIKCGQPSNLATSSVKLKHGLTMVDKASYQQVQSSFSGLMNGWEKDNERVGYNSKNDRSQAHRSPAIKGDGKNALNTLRNSSSNPYLGSSRKAWRQIADEWEQQKAQYSVNNAMPVEAPDIVHDVEKEDAERNILQERSSSEIFPSLTYNSDPFVQQSAHLFVGETTELPCNPKECDTHSEERKRRLTKIYDKVVVVDNVSTAEEVVCMLTTKYRNHIHACDTEVAKIDVKQETPVDHGEIICFSIYSGPQAEFGNGKSYIWVDVLDGGRDVLMKFAPFFEDQTIKKVWHNYSFDRHIMENYGVKVSGFHADTMHLARLWDSSRRIDGGYSLEALTSDPIVMSGTGFHTNDEFMGKISMKSLFGKRKVKKDGSEGKSITIAPVELLQREETIPWICYSVSDSINTLRLYESLKAKLESMDWVFDGVWKGSMYEFYEEYWRPFGNLLANMEAEGLLVDRGYLSNVEKVAVAEQEVAADKFRSWASKYCPDAKFMNVGSDAQIRQLFFGGAANRKDEEQKLPNSKTFKVLNAENVTEDGKKIPSKYRNITLHCFDKDMQAEFFTASGWPSVSGDALKAFAGKISPDGSNLMVDGFESEPDTKHNSFIEEPSDNSRHSRDLSVYGTAYDAFGRGKEGKEACHAIAALCEVCSIDSLISNFILPLQGTHISGKNGRIHCSLNINTETGRLSARRPSLQNQPALEKDRYKIRQAFIAGPGNSLIVADYGQLELRILAHLSNCKSMLDAFKAGGDFHSRTAMNMYAHVRKAVDDRRVLLEWHPQTGEEKPPVPLLKDAFAAERRKAKMLNFSIAYGKTPVGLSRDWKVSLKEAKETVKLWYKDRQEVLRWQEERKKDMLTKQYVHTLLGRARRFPSVANVSNAQKGHIERAAINTPVQGSAADVAMCAMLAIDMNTQLKELGWRLILQVHDEVILEGPTESAEIAKVIVVECMSKPFKGTNILKVDLVVDAKCAHNWYAAK